MLDSPDGWPPNLDASAQRWSVASPRLDAKQLVADQTSLALAGPEGRLPGSASHAAAIQFLQARLVEIGLAPVGDGYTHEFTSSERGPGTNVLARLEGSEANRRCMLVGAHYDGVGCRGASGDCHAADDNASGVAATLALASYLKSHPPRHCVLFALFDLEEAGLVGSHAFVDSPPEELRPLSEHVAFVMIGDMLSRSSRAQLIGSTRSDWLGDLFAATQTDTPIALTRDGTALLDGGHDDPLLNYSDSGPFSVAGIPTMLLCSGKGIMLHGASDSLQCTDPVFFAAAAEVELAILLKADQALTD
jgi:Zn-dependent M28 family amino/carboxypeptidase